MKIALVTDKKIAETSSKGNQEKWLDRDTNKWYKLDAFGYEALSECAVSKFLEYSNVEGETPFRFVRYSMERVIAHNRERIACVSENFLESGEAIITLATLLSKYFGMPVTEKLSKIDSDKKRIACVADSVAECTGLTDFGRYMTLLFEIDSLFLNDDRHLNNIAVIKKGEKYSYCPIFDNGAALLSNVGMSPMNVSPGAFVSKLVARPFMTTFTRQMNSARTLFGKQLDIPRFTRADISAVLEPYLSFYPDRDRAIISDRVSECILTRQKFL